MNDIQPPHMLSAYVTLTSIVYLHRIIENILPIFQFILHVFFSYNMYIIDNKECKIKILKNMKNFYCYSYDDNKDPLRFIIDKKIIPSYFAYIEEGHTDYVYVFCKKETFESMIQENYVKKSIILSKNHIPINERNTNENEHDDYDSDDIDMESRDKCDELLKQNSISYLSFSGSYGHFFITERKINLSNIHTLEWYEYQNTLFRDIMNFYKENNFCKVFLNGEPGKGKTFFAYLMAQRLNCYLTDQYNPTDPGSSLNALYHRAKKVSPNKPLIIVLDEVDVLLNKIHNKELSHHKHYKSEIYDKTSWNQFHDKISYGLYPYLIIIMISNKNKKYIEDMDSAYLRKGRTNLFIEW